MAIPTRGTWKRLKARRYLRESGESDVCDAGTAVGAERDSRWA